MAEKTLHEERIARDEAADRLEAIADQLRGSEQADIDVGNKTVTLSPREEIAYEVGVRESSSVLRGSRETVSLKLDWKPE
ncbi:amphi-Trp domain-containing protein [Halomicrococcus sp. NG-SE-24]|uniref:amphi-Trp domain-containing protein n=1 Tax=Halomicrococcus sp. NG-SE-24 TaxID=3436928 RepID=UPI003D96096C